MTDTSDEIIVAFSYSTRQHTKALERTREVRLLQNFSLGLVAVYFGTKGFEWIQGEVVMSEAWPWSLLKNAMMFMGLTLPYWSLRMVRAQTQSKDGDGTAQTFRFTRDGFALSEKAPLTPWGLMDRVTEVKGAFLLKDSLSKWPVYMPTASISPADLEKLRGIVRAEFTSRPNNLKLLGA